jgi:hypothetical protein
MHSLISQSPRYYGLLLLLQEAADLRQYQVEALFVLALLQLNPVVLPQLTPDRSDSFVLLRVGIFLDYM